MRQRIDLAPALRRRPGTTRARSVTGPGAAALANRLPVQPRPTAARQAGCAGGTPPRCVSQLCGLTGPPARMWRGGHHIADPSGFVCLSLRWHPHPSRPDDPPMPNDLYDRDVLAWSEHQADRLRRLARGERVNDLDWEHVVEEIEDVGSVGTPRRGKLSRADRRSRYENSGVARQRRNQPLAGRDRLLPEQCYSAVCTFDAATYQHC